MKYTIVNNNVVLNLKRYWLIEMINQKIIINKDLSACLTKKRARDIINGNEILFDYVINQFDFIDDKYAEEAKILEKEYQEMIKKTLVTINMQIERVKFIKKQ